jgi:endonuclease III
MPTTSGSRTPSHRKKSTKKFPGPDVSLKRRFQSRLLKWYGKHGRDLPWRKTSDPYHILVSEVMLQQTQVDRVIPKYHEFLGRYPSFEELADAPVSDVKKTWYPLGYNIRPERLHSMGANCRAMKTNCCRLRESVVTRPGQFGRLHSMKMRRSWILTSFGFFIGCS